MDLKHFVSHFPEGEVVKLTPHAIHVVVLGFSSAVIADDDIRYEFKHKLVSVLVLKNGALAMLCLKIFLLRFGI